MKQIGLPLYFRYVAKHYFKNLIAVLFGLAFAFAAIDYFQHLRHLDTSGNQKILYIYYMWQEALGLLYPLAIVFALIMTKLSFVKQGVMGALHAFGYTKKRLVLPFLGVATLTYLVFIGLHTTSFSYAKDKAKALLEHQVDAYNVNDLFFKYNDTFVYMKKLDPIEKRLEDITIFKVTDKRVRYTIHAPYATFDHKAWQAHDAILKTHIYENEQLKRYKVEYKPTITTLRGYKPKIMESLYEGKALSLLDAYQAWKLIEAQHLDSNKVRASLYGKSIMPLFSLALLIILFFKMPYHERMMRQGIVIALSLGVTFVIWGLLFGLHQIGANGVLLPEVATILPVLLLWLYAIYIYMTDEKRIRT